MRVKLLNIKTRDDCVIADNEDNLKKFRDKFIIPDKFIYMMGNSLGLCPKKAQEVASRVILDEWGQHTIEGWSKSDWFTSSQRIGNKLGKLVGAEDNETIIAESTSVSIFKCLATSIGIQKIDNPERRVIVLEKENFPTDNYIAEGLLHLIATDGYEIRYFDEKNPIENVVGEDTVLVLLSLVNYRTGRKLIFIFIPREKIILLLFLKGQFYDMKSITSKIHESKAHVIWDLCHATGAVPVNLNEVNADFAMGCTYKYLNSGPGGPSYLWVNKKHHNRVWQPITGWFGHANPFKMDHKYQPAKGIAGFISGTTQILPVALVECGIDIFLETNMNEIREKSLFLSDLFIELMDEKCPDLKLVTPRLQDKRGSHVAYQHENALEISKFLRKQKLMCDFRHPNIIRFAITPLYLRFVDIWDAVDLIFYALQNITRVTTNGEIIEIS